MVEARGLAGGLAILWLAGIKLECLWTTERVNCCEVRYPGKDLAWKLMGVYGTPYRREKEESRNGLKMWLQSLKAFGY